MFARIRNISLFQISWLEIRPHLRYAVGAVFIFGISSFLNYDLAYLTPVLALGYLAPGAKPLSLKQGASFVIILAVLTAFAVVFSEMFMEYALVFIPLLLLVLLWIYYTDKLPMIVKLFALVSLVIIPFVSIDAGVIGSFVASKLVFNAFMAILLSQIVFLVFPYCEADKPFEKQKQNAAGQQEQERLNHALNIILVVAPLLLAFYAFKWSSSVLILTFVAILSVSPALSNPKVGLAMIIANSIGGLFGILAYKLLVIVPNFAFMIMVCLAVALMFANKLFSDSKFASVFNTALSTFLLILGSVTSSDDEAGSKVYTRVIQIALAVTYVVVAFKLLNYWIESKTRKS